MGKGPREQKGAGQSHLLRVCPYFTGAWWECSGSTALRQSGPSPSQAFAASAQSLGPVDCPRGLAWILWPWGLTAGRLHDGCAWCVVDVQEM